MKNKTRQEQRKHDNDWDKRTWEWTKSRRGLGKLLRGPDVGIVHLIARVRTVESDEKQREITLVANRNEHNDSFM